MKDTVNKGYRNDEGILVTNKIPVNRVRCYWSSCGYDCESLAIKGYIWCEKHDKIMHKINGRQFKINPQVKGALLRNE